MFYQGNGALKSLEKPEKIIKNPRIKASDKLKKRQPRP